MHVSAKGESRRKQHANGIALMGKCTNQAISSAYPKIQSLRVAVLFRTEKTLVVWIGRYLVNSAGQNAFFIERVRQRNDTQWFRLALLFEIQNLISSNLRHNIMIFLTDWIIIQQVHISRSERCGQDWLGLCCMPQRVCASGPIQKKLEKKTFTLISQ